MAKLGHGIKQNDKRAYRNERPLIFCVIRVKYYPLLATSTQSLIQADYTLDFRKAVRHLLQLGIQIRLLSGKNLQISRITMLHQKRSTPVSIF